MTQAAANPDPIELLARMVANSAAFQTEVAKYTEQEATLRVHRVFAEKPDELPRPFALIEPGDDNAMRIAGGDRNSYKTESDLVWWLASEMAYPDDAAASVKYFWEWSKQVLDEVLELGGYDDNLNIMDVTTDQRPTISNELSGNEVVFVWRRWRVQYGTF